MNIINGFFHNNNNEKVNIEDLNFFTPNKSGVKYLAKVDNEIFIDINNNQNDIIIDSSKHEINIPLNEKNSKILGQFYRIDELILENAYNNCFEWFKKKIKKQLLEKLYLPSILNDTLTIKCDPNLLKKTNFGNSYTITIQFIGIEFYKSNFISNLIVKKIYSDNIETISKVDFISYIEKRTESSKLEIINDLIDSTEDVGNSNTSNTEDIQDMISQVYVSEDIKSQEIKPVIQPNDIETLNEINQDIQTIENDSIYNIDNIQNINNEKRQEIIDLFDKAETASKNADLLKLQAIKGASELRDAIK